MLRLLALPLLFAAALSSAAMSYDTALAAAKGLVTKKPNDAKA